MQDKSNNVLHFNKGIMKINKKKPVDLIRAN